MQLKFKLLVCTFVNLISFGAYAQFDYSPLFQYAEFDASQADKLFLRIEDNNYFRNYEYFGDYIEGYTMLGYDVAPSLMYYAGDKVRLTAGVHVKKISGQDSYSDVLPIFSIHTRLTPHLDVVIGSLRGSIHHGMLEPIFDPERLYNNPVESGLQFIYNSAHWHADTWVNWEQYITQGDNKPEKFTFGFSSSYDWLRDSAHWQIKTPVQLLAAHTGGQISNYNEPMQSLTNAAIGLEFLRKPKSSRFHEIKATFSALGYKDLTKKSGLPFNAGRAIYSTIGFSTRQLQIMAGYFASVNFVAPRGSALFQSVSSYNPQIYNKHRNIITSKFLFTHQLIKDIKFGMMAETYYDMDAGQLEYAYGVNLVVLPTWFLLKKPLAFE